MTPRGGRWRVGRRSGPVALPPERELVGPEWDSLVAREVAQQARIEAAFDRVDACERLGDLDCALAWLARAEELGSGLPRAYRAQRARWSRQSRVRQQGLAIGTGEVRADAVDGENRSRC
jgi:hypothetical protein